MIALRIVVSSRATRPSRHDTRLDLANIRGLGGWRLGRRESDACGAALARSWQPFRYWRDAEVSECALHFRLLDCSRPTRHVPGTSKMTPSRPSYRSGQAAATRRLLRQTFAQKFALSFSCYGSHE